MEKEEGEAAIDLDVAPKLRESSDRSSAHLSRDMMEEDGDGFEKEMEKVTADLHELDSRANGGMDHGTTNGTLDDDGDEVLKEIDVFMSQNLAKNLHVLQYPLRPPWRSYNRSHLQEVRYKPVKKKMEFEFRTSKEEMEHNYDTQTSNPKKGYVISSTLVEPKTNYAVGVLRGDQLHLTPVHGTFQFRPSFAHIDAVDAEKKKKEKAEKGEEKEEKDEKVVMRVKRAETPKARAARERSHQHQKQKEAEEPWLVLKFKDHDTKPEDTVNVFEKLFSSSHQAVPFDVPIAQYIEQIAACNSTEVADRTPTEHLQPKDLLGASIHQMRGASLEQQVLALLVNAHILQWKKVCEVLSIGEERELELLDAIERSATLVAGRWIIKSELRFEGKLARVREFILYLFNKNRYIKRREFAQATGVSTEVVKQLLSEIATLKKKKNNPQRIWKLKTPAEEDFIHKYPQVVEKYHQHWVNGGGTLFKNLEQVYNAGGLAEGDPMAFISPPGMVAGMQVDGEEEVSKASRDFLKQLFTKHGVCSFNFVKQHFLIQQKDDPILAKVSFKDTFVPVLESMTGTLHNAYYLRSTNSSQDKYRDIVIELFSKDVSVRRGDVLKTIEQRLGESLKESQFRALMKEFATSKGVSWIFKPGNGANK